jgi:phosphoenolpyruvate-protein kinase (PTS system EI component)
MQRLKGIGVSPGVVVGRAVVLMQRAQVLRYRIAPERLAHEVGRLEQSRVRSRQQLHDIRARVSRRRGPELAALFDAQILMLDDPMLVPRAEALVRDERVNAEWAVQQVFEEFSLVFDEVADPYLRERKGDVADLVGRLKMNLRQDVTSPRDLLRAVEEASVLVAASSRPRSPPRSTGPRYGASPRTPAAGPITPPSWHARSTCQRWSDSTRP